MNKAMKYYQLALYFMPGSFGLLFLGFMAQIADQEIPALILMSGSFLCSMLLFVFAGIGFYHDKKGGFKL